MVGAWWGDGHLIVLFIYLKRIIEKIEPGSSQWRMLKRREPTPAYHNKAQGKKCSD